MNYLRSVLSQNYEGEEDAEFLMVSCPRIIPFEILIIDFALKLLDKVGKRFLFKKRSLAKDVQELAELNEKVINGSAVKEDFQLIQILKNNVANKEIFEGHVKTL